MMSWQMQRSSGDASRLVLTGIAISRIENALVRKLGESELGRFQCQTLENLLTFETNKPIFCRNGATQSGNVALEISVEAGLELLTFVFGSNGCTSCATVTAKLMDIHLLLSSLSCELLENQRYIVNLLICPFWSNSIGQNGHVTTDSQ